MTITREHIARELESLNQQIAHHQRTVDQIVGAKAALNKMLVQLDAKEPDKQDTETT